MGEDEDKNLWYQSVRFSLGDTIGHEGLRNTWAALVLYNTHRVVHSFARSDSTEESIQGCCKLPTKGVGCTSLIVWWASVHFFLLFVSLKVWWFRLRLLYELTMCLGNGELFLRVRQLMGNCVLVESVNSFIWVLREFLQKKCFSWASMLC